MLHITCIVLCIIFYIYVIYYILMSIIVAGTYWYHHSPALCEGLCIPPLLYIFPKILGSRYSHLS